MRPSTRTRCLSIILLLSAGELAWAEEPVDTAAAASQRFDQLGDPLFEEALLRFGTQRFRYPTEVIDIGLSPDEKTIVAIGRELLIAWDTATGKELWRANCPEHDIALFGASYGLRGVAFAPDGSHFYTPGGQNEIIRWEVRSGNHESVKLVPGFQLKEFLGLGISPMKSVDVSRDGTRLAAGNQRGLVVCDPQGKALFNISNNPAAPVEADDMNRDRLNFGGDFSMGIFAPDGESLAVVLSEAPQEFRLVNSQDGQEQRRIPTTDKIVRWAFSPDGKQIVATERDSTVRLYDVDTGKELWAFKIELKNNAESYTSAVSFAPDGKLIAACAPIGSDHDIYLLDAASGEQVNKLVGHIWKPWAVAFTRDSKRLYSSGWDGVIRRWDVETGKQLALPGEVRATGVIAASPAEPLVAYEDEAGTIHLANSTDGKEVRTISLPGAEVSQLAFSPDGKQLAGGGAQGDEVHATIWNVADGKQVAHWSWPKGNDPHSQVEALSFRPDGQKLAAAVFRQSAAYLFDLASNEQSKPISHSEIYGLAFSPDGETLATVGWDSLLQLWDAKTGESKSASMVDIDEDYDLPSEDSDLRMYAVSYSPKGDLLATGHMNNSVRIWATEGLKFQRQIKGIGFSYGALAFSPDGASVATGARDGTVAVWDAATGEKAWSQSKHGHHVYTVCFGHDGKSLISGADDGLCYVWELPSKAASE